MATAAGDGGLDSRAAAAEHQLARGHGGGPRWATDEVVTRLQAGERLLIHMPHGTPDGELQRAAAEVKRLAASGGVLVTAPDVRVFVVPAGVDSLDIEVREDEG